MTRGVALAWLAAIVCAADARAQLPGPGRCAGVYWDLTAVFDAGDELLARVLLTRAGPGDLNAAGQGHWRDPEGVTTPFQNGRTAGRFEVDASGRRLEIGSTGLDLARASHSFAVDNDKRGVKLRVVFAPGTAVDETVHEGGLAISVLHLGSRVTASVWRRGMAAPRELTGRATLVRTTHAVCERDLVSLRGEVHGLAGPAAWLWIHERLNDGRDRNWLGWRGEDGSLATRRPDETRLEAWREAAGERLPRHIATRGDGIRGGFAIGSPFLAHDPLDALPRIVRMLYWFGADPWRVWAEADAEFSTASRAPDVPSLPPRGPALASFTFLREPIPTVPPPDGD